MQSLGADEETQSHLHWQFYFGKSCEEVPWNHCTSTPHRSETNGIAERAVRRVTEGTSAVLLQSGLDEKWVADSMECYCYLIQDLLSDGKTQYEMRFGMLFDGPVIPFGAMVEYHLLCAKRFIETTPVWSESLAWYIPWICIVCGENLERWLDGRRHELEQMDTSELHARRLNAKEVFTPMKGDNFLFPVADGTVKVSGGDQDLRTSTFIRDRPERGEEQGTLVGESDGSSSTPFRDSSLYDGEARNYFWSISGNFIYRHHVAPNVPREASFLILPLQAHHWMKWWRNISTILGTLMEFENCQIRGQVSKDSLHWMKNHRMDILCLGWDWQENRRPQDGTKCGQICGSLCLMHRNAKRGKSGQRRKVLRGESDGLSSPTPLQGDSTRDDAEAKNDFWSITGDFIHRHHVEPRVALYVPKEDSFPIPQKYVDVARNTHTSLYGLCWRKILMIIGTWMEKENNQMRGQAAQDSFCCTKGHLTDIHGPRRLTRKQTTSRTDNAWLDMWKHMSDAAKSKAKQNWIIEKPKLENARQLRGIFFIEPDDEDFKHTMKKRS